MLLYSITRFDLHQLEETCPAVAEAFREKIMPRRHLDSWVYVAPEHKHHLYETSKAQGVMRLVAIARQIMRGRSKGKIARSSSTSSEGGKLGM